MIKLKFEINKKYLLVRSLRFLPVSNWIDFQNKLWKNFPETYYLLSSHPEALFIENGTKKAKVATKQIEKFSKFAFKTKQFRKLYKETQNYLNTVKSQWQKNKKKALNTIKELSGLQLPDLIFTVSIVHPQLRHGAAYSEFNTIGWGHTEDWKNYSTIYLCHELMHLLTAKKLKNENVMHILIQLMIDDELKMRLNKEKECREIGKISKKAPIYYQKIAELEKKIYPYWKNYLKSRKGRSIFDLEKEIIAKTEKSAIFK